MAGKNSFELHHNFPKLAEESGFTFNTHRPRVHVDWNKIRQIDIDSLIRDRRFFIIEQHYNDILDCALESEFDVRILDEGVIKMFRLSQLAVEYHQFCRHYLDRSVYVLRDEITSLAKEYEEVKRDLKEKDEEIRRLKRRGKQARPQTHGNENIASIILKTLASRNEIFAANSTENVQHYNKCNYCDKMFLNQLYLSSHIARRHGNVTETPQKDVPNNTSNTLENEDTKKLTYEVMELKTKLIEMEKNIMESNADEKQSQSAHEKADEKQSQSTKANNEDIQDTSSSPPKDCDDGKIIENPNNKLLDKIEEWKKEERANYDKEISLLRSQLLETIASLKDNKTENPNDDDNIIQKLKEKINEQGSQIKKLQEELFTKLQSENEYSLVRKKHDDQMKTWSNHVEQQTKQYDILMQKLKDLSKQANESRELAKIEKDRADELQILLHQNLNNQNALSEKVSPPKVHKEGPPIGKYSNRKTLDELHKKAQELLNIVSESSSDEPSEIKKEEPTSQFKESLSKPKHTMLNDRTTKNSKKVMSVDKNHNKETKVKLNIDVRGTKKNGVPVPAPRSPIKILRAKLSEEVNNRLVSAGVDPLKKTLHRNDFNDYRNQIQLRNEAKNKMNPVRESARNSILSYLDSKISNNKQHKSDINDYVSPNRSSKYNLTTVFSNVKNKALAFVKSNGKLDKIHRDPSKRSSSEQSSPVKQETIDTKWPKNIKKSKSRKKETHMKVLNSQQTYVESEESDESGSEKLTLKKNEANVTSEAYDDLDILVSSPVRRPASAIANYETNSRNSNNELFRTKSADNVTEIAPKNIKNIEYYDSNESFKEEIKDTNDTVLPPTKQTKGVLKNASSMSSLNKKKVIFDMDAIQMKSVSASPSQSITEKSDTNENYGLGLVNIDDEDWDISSIENEPLMNDTKIQLNTTNKTISPKINELKLAIENQLSRRTESSTMLLGVDVLKGPLTKAASVTGSNTSLGSSILDDSDSHVTMTNNKVEVRSKKMPYKNNSESDISDFSLNEDKPPNRNAKAAF